MKAFLVTLLLALPASAQVHLEPDKYMHAGVGAMFGGATFVVTKQSDTRSRIVASLFVPFAIQVLHEADTCNRVGWSRNDAARDTAATMFGAAVSIAVGCLISRECW